MFIIIISFVKKNILCFHTKRLVLERKKNKKKKRTTAIGFLY